MHVKKGDKVVVISGKEKGKIGEVMRVLPKENKVIVENINMITKHNKPMGPTRPGGIVKYEDLFTLQRLCCTVTKIRLE